MLIDEFMSTHDVRERHEIQVAAKPERVFAALHKMDLRRSPIIRALFALRSLPAFSRMRPKDAPPAALGLDLPGLLKSGFVLLGEIPNREIVLGLVGKFWTGSGCLQKVNAQEFSAFNAPGFAKAVWNFSLTPVSATHTRLATETRVSCLDEKSRRRFRLYWLFVRPFSGWIRMEALRCLKGRAEEGAVTE